MMAINFQRGEYTEALDDWKLVDKIADEHDVDDLLPRINPNDLSAENKVRNDQYRDRASFFGATRVTLQSLVGTAFAKDPQITIPDALGYVLRNIDGGGADIYQQMQAAVAQCLRHGGAGLFVTMPNALGEISRADMEAGRAVATVHLVDRSRIINWWLRQDGAETKLAGVVFTDTREVFEDYEIKVHDTRRELAIDDSGMMFDRTWVKADHGIDEWVAEEPIYPRQGNGQPWREIPFLFLGAERNSWLIQVPPLLSLARINRDHFRNSADNEDALWYAGQVQPWASGIRQDDVADMKSANFYIGSRQMLVCDHFEFAQSSPNSAIRQAMIDKVELMAALGARLVQPGQVAKTATQSAGELSAQHSALSLVSVNVEDGYQWALEAAANYMNAAGDIEVKLDRSFMEPAMTAERVKDIRDTVLSGLAGPEAMLKALKAAGYIDTDKPLADYLEEIASRGANAVA